jgi:hypothetical protein
MGFISWWKGESALTKQSLFDSFLDMPFILKFLTLGTFIYSGLSLLFAFPNDGITLNGRFVTYDYLWSSGMVWVFIVTGLAWPYSGYMMLRRRKYSREVYLSVMGLIMLGGGIPDWTSWINVAWMTPLQLAILGLYLYKRKPVIKYFSRTF